MYYGARSLNIATNKFVYSACMTIPLAGLVTAGYWTTRLMYAALSVSSPHTQSIALAGRLDPWNPSYRAGLAAQLEQQTADPSPQLRAAAALDPFNSAW